MNIILESDIEFDNDKIISEIQEIIPDAEDVFVRIRSQRQHNLLRKFDSALDRHDAETAKLALKQFKGTLYAPDGTATIKLMRIELVEAGGDDDEE